MTDADRATLRRFTKGLNREADLQRENGTPFLRFRGRLEDAEIRGV